MVGIVKWLRPRVVAPVYVGSNPTTHPINEIDVGVSPSGKATDSDSVMRRFESCYPSQLWRHSQVVRQRSAKPLFPGSNPGVASNMVGIVKWLRQRVVAPLCVGSNPTIHPIN